MTIFTDLENFSSCEGVFVGVHSFFCGGTGQLYFFTAWIKETFSTASVCEWP